MKNVKKLLMAILTLCLASCLFIACDDPSKPQKHTIFFDVEGETYYTVQTAGNEVISLPSEPQKTGFAFDGWYFDDGEWLRPLTENSLRLEALLRDTFVYAKWTKNDYNVRADGFDKDHGRVIGQDRYEYGDAVSLSFEMQNGCIFGGWYLGEELVSNTTEYSFDMPAQDVALTVRCYKVSAGASFKNAGEISVDLGKYAVGDRQSFSASSTNLGYTWVGWFDGEQKLTDDMEVTVVMPARDVELTAKWQVNDEMSNYTFNSTQTTCEITGVIDKSLTAMSIPSYVDTIGFGAFENCAALESIYVPDNVTTINKNAFKGCYSLQSVSLPFCGKTVNSSGGANMFGYIFGTTYYLSQNEYVPTSLKEVEIRGGYSLELKAFWGCAFIETVKLPDTLTELNGETFRNCRNLKTVYLPARLARIGAYDFANCDNLTDIYFAGSAAQWENVVKSKQWDYKTENYTVHFAQE